MSNLQARLLAAHERGDHDALVGLYREAADGAGTADAAGYFLTHAYIFALETNHADAPALRARLVAMGRED
jgi:hypothetical protein